MGTDRLPMFPLGSVLFPAMPLGLRVFEPRYLQLMADVVAAPEHEFGVVLIERGHEVGGGDGRFGAGVVATVLDLGEKDGTLAVSARGGRRLRVTDWLPDEPYPRAEVEILEPLVWDDTLEPERASCEALVRRCLAIASEFSDTTWPSDVDLADDPVQACWQLAAIAPLGPMDQIGLLQSTSLADLLTRLRSATEDALELIRLQIAVQTPDEPGSPDEP